MTVVVLPTPPFPEMQAMEVATSLGLPLIAVAVVGGYEARASNAPPMRRQCTASGRMHHRLLSTLGTEASPTREIPDAVERALLAADDHEPTDQRNQQPACKRRRADLLVGGHSRVLLDQTHTLGGQDHGDEAEGQQQQQVGHSSEGGESRQRLRGGQRQRPSRAEVGRNDADGSGGGGQEADAQRYGDRHG